MTLNFRTGLCSLIAPLLAMIPLILMAPAPAQAARGASRGDSELRVATYNIRSDRTVEQFAAGVTALQPRADVIGLQEIGMTAKHWWLDDDSGWDSYNPEYYQQEPVIWNPDVFSFVSARGALLARRNGIVKNPWQRTDCWATVVRLRHRPTGRLVTFINVHLQSAAVRGGEPNPDRLDLFSLYKRQTANLVLIYLAEKLLNPFGQVYVMGDFNAGYNQDLRTGLGALPLQRLTPLGLRSMWEDSAAAKQRRGTMKDADALIDQVWSPTAPERVQIADDITISDHYPAIATYAIRPIG